MRTGRTRVGSSRLPLAMLLWAACGAPPPLVATSLKSALGGPALRIGVTLGEPSRLELAPGGRQYLKAGAGAQLRLGVKSSEVSVASAGSAAGVRLTPVAGPQKFSSWGAGIASGEAVVYPSPDGRAAVVERAGTSGLEEDIVLTRSLGDSLRFEWEVQLGDGLEARLDSDGSVGVYGVSSVLARDIQVGDDKSRALLEQARRQARKTEARFRIPAPRVRVATGEVIAGVAQLELGQLRGDRVPLRVVATGLDALAYPLSIDPSVLVTSAPEFERGGNLEGGTDVEVTGARVVRGKPQIGLGAFAATTSFPTARVGHTSVAYNGHLYVIGGTAGGVGLDDVQVATINANGTVGAFAATSSFTTGRYGHSSVAYNGFLYVIGGYGGGLRNDIQLAPINADGTLGAFSVAISFPTPRSYHTTVAYNGYLYVIGGGNGAGYLNDVQVAAINGNGTLGAFAATSSFTTPRGNFSSVAYNGFLYVLGGNNSSGGKLNDVQVATINANGTLGTFVATTSFPAARAGHAGVAYNGCLYVIGGGDNSGDFSDVQVAPINANGGVGAFSATSSFSVARDRHTSVAYNGYLYVLGGYDGSLVRSDVQVAPLNVAGTLGAFTATTSFASARHNHSSVAYNGYLYVIGGTNGANLNDVRVAQINANGTVGAFAATTSFSVGRYGHTSVAYNGYLYVIGGDTGVGYRNDVQVAPINANGTLGVFGPTSLFTTARGYHTSVVYNATLYVIGGSAPGQLSDVQQAPINSDGTLGAFSPTTSFATARSSHTSVAYNGYLYVIGGTNGAPLGDVQLAPINANGTLGAFTSTTAVPTARHSHATVANNGYLYIVGGFGGGPLSDVQLAPINGNGTLGSFLGTSAFTTARNSHTAVGYNGSLYVLGGTNSTDLGDVQVATINVGGTLGAFGSTTSFPTPRNSHSSVAYNGFLYVIGGTNAGSYQNDVQVAPINANGTLGGFTPTTALPTGRYFHSSVAYNGYLYVIGGNSSTATPLDEVRVAPINANGTLGAFTATTAVSAGRRLHASVAWGGYLYVIGGTNIFGALLNDVQVAPINADGSLGAFTATASFATGATGLTGVAYNGYLYVIGGYAGGSSYLSDVQVAAINSDGSLGTFAPTTSIPGPRSRHTSVAADGYLYVAGGSNAAGNLSDVEVAPINSNGTLGAFTATYSFPTARYGHTSVASNGWLYLLGGYGGGYLSDVRLAPLGTPAAKGSYAKVVDFGVPATVASITVNGSATRGDVRLEYRTAPPFGGFGPSVVKGVVPLGTAVVLTGSNARYLWVRFTLDDTSAAVISPDATNQRDLTAFTVVYNPDPTVAPANPTVPPKGAQAFTCSGGSGSGYVFAVSPNNSGGSVNPSTGAYLAGVTGNVLDTVTCTDSVAATGATAVTVTAAVAISPSSLSRPPRGSQAFTATGGSGTGYIWAFVTNNSGGTLSGAGAYQAGATGSVVDTVRVTDSLGNTATALVTVTAQLSILPASVSLPPRGSQAFTASGGSGAGLVWGPITNSSGMTLVAATGQYTAGAVGGVTDVIGVTDSLGNTATRSITVTGALTLAPVSATVPPRGTQLFVPDGGSGSGFSWSLPSNASGGSIDGGTYVAGPTGSVTDLAQATDSLGNTATVSITVTPGVSATPPSASVSPRGGTSFSATGGSGTGFAWSFQTPASGGSITAAGAYTAGAIGSVIDVLRVTDSLGNFAAVNVSVSPSITINPAAASTPPSGAVGFTATNGSGSGYAWSLVTSGSSGPTINPSTGAYKAGTQLGTDVVGVTDSLGNTATVTVNVTNALAVTPATVSLAPRASQTFTGSGGSSTGFVWTLVTNNSGATFNPATAAYQAGPTGGVSDTVRLTDSLGNIANATISVTAGVAVSPVSPAVVPKQALTFTAGGGSATGFSWSLQTNASGGTLAAATGAYVAGPVGGVTDIVRATDSLGNVGTASVAVGPAVSISPAGLSLAPRATQALTAAGGSNLGFMWSFVANASAGSLGMGSGVYTAGKNGAVSDVVQVADSLGNTVQLTINVTAGVSISPSASASLPLGMRQLVAAGGSGAGFSWSLTANRSGATLGATTGLYQAGTIADVVDELAVVDSLGNVGTATVTVTERLAITPLLPTVAPRQPLTFTASGGSGTRQWTLATNASGGSIDPGTGVYRAGPTGKVTDLVSVKDALGSLASATVTVTDAITISPATTSLSPGAAQTFTAKGGSEAGFTWSLSGNASGGSIVAATGAYVAGSTGNVSDEVKVTDSLGNLATAPVTVATATADAGRPARSHVGFGCGCGASSAGAPFLLLALLGFVARPRSRRVLR